MLLTAEHLWNMPLFTADILVIHRVVAGLSTFVCWYHQKNNYGTRLMDASPIAAISQALHLRRSGSAYRGPCPIHGGAKSPFALRHGAGGTLLVHCHAGCDPARILAA